MSRTGPYRLAEGARTQAASGTREWPIRFRFNGRMLAGRDGDSLASALLANGILTIRRSLKYHRPRGLYSCGSEEPNGLVQLASGSRAVPMARATMVELHEGLEAFSRSGWPSLSFDLGRVLDFTSPLWAAGFYNKTFMWPSWRVYEWLLRRMAGIGRAPTQADPDRYDVRNLHCDVLVIGGGVSGVAAARAAVDAGRRVVVVEQNAELRAGGKLWQSVSGDQPRVLTRSTAVGYYDHNVLTVLERSVDQDARPGLPRERYWIIRAGRVVLATGAIEQPLIFCNNDRPGILLAGAMHHYLRRHHVAPGQRVLLATNNDSVYQLARDLKDLGVEVLGVVDSRPDVSDVIRRDLTVRNIPLFSESMPVDTGGFRALKSVTVGRLTRANGRIESRTFACDALGVSGGWSPALHLFAQAGGKLCYDEASGALHPAAAHPLVDIVGSAADRVPTGPRVCPVGNTRRQWVDLLHDVTVSDLELALREGYTAIEHVKRYTTVGMAPDQGKTSSATTLEIVARLSGANPSELSHTTLRPPVIPITLGAIAGRAIGERFAPSRLLPMHDWHAANGAFFEDFGAWKRPGVYLCPGESRAEALSREARAVRTAAGLFDGSPLGKIEVQGPDALQFLDRFYINDLTSLKTGRVRYGLMLRESGVLLDDGTVVRLRPDHYLITTTSGNATRVAAWLEEWHQCEWPYLRVAITQVTEQWATVSLAGPRARQILAALRVDVDLSSTGFPHLEMREGHVLGELARIYRVSFSGELTYEINVNSRVGPMVWDALLDAGKPYGLQPIGVDALLLLRLEKGFLHIGTDTDGTTVPDDIGWGRVALTKRADFIGKRSLKLPENLRPDRRQLVGLLGQSDLIVGSHLRLPDAGEPTDGWITSAGIATLTGEPIALALLRSGRGQLGGEVTVYDTGAPVARARVVNPPFYDSAGERMNA